MSEPFIIIAAFALDLLIGDPPWFPHPVVIIGKIITLGESLLNRGGKIFQMVSGIFLVLLVTSLSAVIPYFLLWLLARVSWYLVLPVNIFLCSLTIATRGLREAALEILRPLQKENLIESRHLLSRIVGRDTETLNETEVIKATVESVAENSSDGIIAPLFYMSIGGAPLAYAYKAINTLDSMLGYKNKRCIHFGWGAARLDDLANIIPARITAILVVLSSLLLGKSWRNSFRILFQDGHKHPSPNAGYPEAAMAGALGVQLGGPSSYGGERVVKPFIGEPLKPLHLNHIIESIQLITVAPVIYLTLYLVFAMLS